MKLKKFFDRCQTLLHRLLFPAFHKKMREMEYELGPKPPKNYNCQCVINPDAKYARIHQMGIPDSTSHKQFIAPRDLRISKLIDECNKSTEDSNE